MKSIQSRPSFVEHNEKLNFPAPILQPKLQPLQMWMAELKKRQVDFEAFTQKVGYEVFRRSNQRFQRTSYNENDVFVTKFRTSWISEQEFCFQPRYDAQSRKPITDQGYFFHLVTTHNPANLDDKKVDCMTVDFHGRPSSLTRYTQATAVNDGFIEDVSQPKMISYHVRGRVGANRQGSHLQIHFSSAWACGTR